MIQVGRIRVAQLIIGIFLAQLSAQAGAHQFGDPTKDIKAFEEAMSSAIGRNDAGALEHYLSSDWTIVSGSGLIITRSTFLQVMAGGDLVHQSMAPQGQTIRIHGNFAVVTARIQSGGTYKGIGFHNDEINTDVLAKEHGHWVCVLRQLTTVAPTN